MENSSSVGIKRSSDFLSIKQSGKRHWPTKWLLLNYQKNSVGQLRFGVTASRKVGSAVVRNKLKRWSREYFRALLKAENSIEADINLIFKPMDPNFYKGLPHEEFVKAMDRGIETLRKHL
ncbi:MAG: ribonuclease P protein component [Bdellovibrio sp.]|nr:ribonuclease P protein component [Bdellovibrio sp.]